MAWLVQGERIPRNLFARIKLRFTHPYKSGSRRFKTKEEAYRFARQMRRLDEAVHEWFDPKRMMEPNPLYGILYTRKDST